MFEEVEKYIYGLRELFNKKKGRKFTKVGKYWVEVEFTDRTTWIGVGDDAIILEVFLVGDNIEYINITNWDKFKEMFNDTNGDVVRDNK